MYLIFALSLACGQLTSKFDSHGDSPVRKTGANPQSWQSAGLFSTAMVDNEWAMVEGIWPTGYPRLMLQPGLISMQLEVPIMEAIMLANPPTCEDGKGTQSFFTDDDAW